VSPMFEWLPDGSLRPARWTDPHPPKPYASRVFTPARLDSAVASAVTAAVFALPQPGWLGTAGAGVLVAGLGFCAVYCTLALRHWWQVVRWRHSPAPTDTLDDL
jgi:hypothetical protein